MSVPTVINCCLIFAGAIVMLISIVRAKGPLQALPFVPESHRRQVTRYLVLHRTLMIFFLCGYLVVLAASAFNLTFISGTFVSIIFLSGAIFVYIGIVVQSRLLAGLQTTLHGILPICCQCKKIRFDNANSADPGAWQGIEQYISERTKVNFSHGYCPKCFEEAKNTIQNFSESITAE